MNRILMPLMVAALLLQACASKQQKHEDIQLVKTDIVKPHVAVFPIHYPGKIKAANDINIAFRVAGPIHYFPVEEGQFVKKGQLIAQIDPRDYELQLAATKAEYDQIKKEAERVIELHKRNSVATNDYDKAVAGLNRITVKYKSHQNALNDTKLVAPFDGYIQKKYFDNHETVSAGLPIVSIISANSFEIETDIPAADYVRQEQFTNFSCHLDVYPDQVFTLELLEITKKSNLNQLYKVRLRLDNQPDYKLAAGMSANVTIQYAAGNETLVGIPLSAVFETNNQSKVWIMNGNHTLEARAVQVRDILKNGQVVISSGLKKNEIIVTAGVHTLKEGQKVKELKPVSKTNVGGLL
ncbi:efflux RND transporter periplasmic adaptor subunit [Marinilabiliaceae bacterium JC017]|nr:efflux RND transporter periplasmic adaptor subunit [Marinilabiliaceae bacterium JC017]